MKVVVMPFRISEQQGSIGRGTGLAYEIWSDVPVSSGNPTISKGIPRNDTRDRLPVTDDAKIAEFGCGFPCPDTDEAM
jgi:hypothetical protein